MVIKEFQGENRFLSNFYISSFIVDGIKYETVEHYYQSMKGQTIIDRTYIRTARTPSQAKHRGRNVDVRHDWDAMKVYFMNKGIYAKFTQSLILKNKLLATGGLTLREGNRWGDTYWGTDLCGDGQNILGQLLMALRDILR